MTVGELIIKVRKEDGLTQEKFGELFGISRQTVSSWENGKSFPDLQLLINICDYYQISLDSLLHDNSQMIQKMDFNSKLVKISKYIFILLGIFICIFFINVIVWEIYTNNKEKAFETNITDNGFILENGVYEKTDGNITFYVPNQKYPFLRYHFHVDKVQASISDSDVYINIKIQDNCNFITLSFKGVSDYSILVSQYGEIMDSSTVSNSEKILYETYKEDIKKCIEDGVILHDEIYH